MSKCIRIPFMPEFQDVMLSGKKTATTRFRKYGSGGDTFYIFGALFQLKRVSRVFLSDVGSQAYEKEGFKTQQEFWDCWNKLHPKRNTGSEIVFYHEFEKLSC